MAAGRIWGRLNAAIVRLQRYPARFTGSYPWVSEKQRRYVIMMIRRGEIKVPYQRTRGYAQGWKIIKTDKGYALTNPAKAAKWIGGDAYGQHQARIHQGRWQVTRTVVDESLAELPKEIADHIVMVARRRGYQAQ